MLIHEEFERKELLLENEIILITTIVYIHRARNTGKFTSPSLLEDQIHKDNLLVMDYSKNTQFIRKPLRVHHKWLEAEKSMIPSCLY